MLFWIGPKPTPLARGIYSRGRVHTENTKQKMRDNNAMKNEKYRNKISIAKKGIKYLWQDGKFKMAVPGSDKWNYLISEGYIERTKY